MLKPWLRLARVPLAATAVCDALACAAFAVCATHGDLATFGVGAALQLAATSLLLYLGGMAANDLADRHTDPEDRPLPSGALRPAAVAVFVGLCLAGAIALGGGARGWRGAAIAAAVLALAYDFGAKRSRIAGPLSMGLVRAANASLAVWPLVLAGASWTLLLAPLVIGLYSAAITVYSWTEDHTSRPHIVTARLLTVAAFAGAALLVWILGGVPTFGVIVAFGVCSSTIFGRTPKPGRPAKAQVLEMLLALYWLAAVVAGGAHDGTLSTALIVSFAALVVAWLLAVGSQLMIRALRRTA